jgi:hypothetical protein
MSGKYVFSKALKELRFLHCQTSEHSNAVRYAFEILLATSAQRQTNRSC